MLDVGAATGFLGRALAQRGFTVWGVEKDPETARVASGCYKELVVGSLEELQEMPGAPFDIVLCGDVLEHLVDPLSALRKMISWLKHRGWLLACVPNVAFVHVRLALLFGRFTYRGRGVLDASHLRFFTKRTFQDLLHEAGLEVVSIRGLPPPIPLVLPWSARWPGRALLEVAAVAARLWPTLWAYQLAARTRSTA